MIFPNDLRQVPGMCTKTGHGNFLHPIIFIRRVAQLLQLTQASWSCATCPSFERRQPGLIIGPNSHRQSQALPPLLHEATVTRRSAVFFRHSSAYAQFTIPCSLFICFLILLPFSFFPGFFHANFVSLQCSHRLSFLTASSYSMNSRL